MRRFFLRLGVLGFLLQPIALSGCAGLWTNAREVEDLLVIQTMGLDDDPAGIRLTLASAAGLHADGRPLRMEGRGPSVTTAIERVRSLANEEDLFCAHISHVLIGEATARRGLDRELDYICRSPDLRISVPLYVLRGGEAGEAVLNTGDERFGICDALDAVDGDLKRRGDGRVFSAAEVSQELARQGSALICAVALLPSASQETPQEGSPQGAAETMAREGAPSEPLMTVSAVGYGVLKDGRLCAFIDRDKAVAVGLLRNESGPCELVVTDRAGSRVTIALERGETALRPLRDGDGQLTGLELELKAEAALSETGAAGEADAGELTALAEAALSERAAAVLQLSKQLQADFLGLGPRVERADPAAYRAQPPFDELLAELPIRLTVSVRLVRSSDLEDARP